MEDTTPIPFTERWNPSYNVTSLITNFSTMNAPTANLSANNPLPMTIEEEECRMRFDPPYHITAVVIAFIIIAINVFVVVLFIKNRALRKIPANYLLLSLSINDLLSGFSIVIHKFSFYYLLFRGCKDFLDKFGTVYNIAAIMTSHSLLLISIGHMLLLSTERFLRLYYALRYHAIVSKCRIWIAIFLVWCFGSAATLVQLVWNVPYARVKSVENRSFLMKYNYYYIIVSLVTLVFVPSVILVAQYSWLFMLIRRLTKAVPGRKMEKASVVERKALIIYCGMFVCFLICAGPYLSVKLIINVNIELARSIPRQFFEGVFLLRYIVSIVNPVLYTFYKQDFRKAIVHTIPRCKKIIKKSKNYKMQTTECYDTNDLMDMCPSTTDHNNRNSLTTPRRSQNLSYNNPTIEESYNEHSRHLLQ